MLTVKMLKYSKPTFSGGNAGPGQPPIPTIRDPGYTESVDVRPAKRVFVELNDKHGRQVVSVIDPSGDLDQFTVGDAERDDVMFNCVYIMNEAGKTVETIR